MRVAGLWFMLAIAACLVGGTCRAQAPTGSVPALPGGADAAADPLPGLPRLPAEPRSLLAPSGPVGPSIDPFPERYFEVDPRLDPLGLPAPGWFGAVETEITGAHVKNKLVNSVSIGGVTDVVRLPSAELDWTVAPRFDLGYRLPSGFGEFLASCRFLSTDGSENVTGPDGAATQHSRLDLNELDLDYASREFSLWPECDMKWRFGGRLAYIFFDSRRDEPLSEAGAGRGVLESRVSDRYIGFGPHSGLELAQRLGQAGFALVGQVDAALQLGRIRQGFFESSATAGFDAGRTQIESSQAVPMVNAQAGIGWRPPAHPDLQFFIGYEYEYWWNVGRLSTSSSRGEMSDQGLCLRLELGF